MNEVPVVFYEREPHRVVALLRAGLQVRPKRDLEPKFNEPPRRSKPEPVAPPPRRRKAIAAPTFGFVYIFAAGAHIKIGMSDAGVEQRWNSVRTYNPLLEPTVYVTAPLGTFARKVEQAAHRALSQYHENGEWFRCTRETAISVVKGLEKECHEK